jgi:ABC-2 type transport system ATP-binding protein
MSAILLDHVTKRFGSHVAVNDLSLEVPEGSIYGFIGPNGSGKTTTIRMIMHILLPDAGRIAVLGRDDTRAARDDIGFLPEERGLYKKMQVRALLRYYGGLKGKSRKVLDPVIDEWLTRLGLSDWADKKVDTLSKGMAQKVQFISSIVTRPRLVILDEPFSGLDPVNAEALKNAVLELRRQGVTVVFSTHDMASAERLCDRIFMIYKGNKVLDGSLEDVKSRYGHDTVRVRVPGGAAALGRFAGIDSMNDHGNYQDLRLSCDPQALLGELVRSGPVHHFEVTKPSLHDIFVRIANPAAGEMAAPLEVSQ